jgi:hypothetical protein
VTFSSKVKSGFSCENSSCGLSSQEGYSCIDCGGAFRSGIVDTIVKNFFVGELGLVALEFSDPLGWILPEIVDSSENLIAQGVSCNYNGLGCWFRSSDVQCQCVLSRVDV